MSSACVVHGTARFVRLSTLLPLECRRGACFHAEFAEDMLEMFAHDSGADAEDESHLLMAYVLADPVQDSFTDLHYNGSLS